MKGIENKYVDVSKDTKTGTLYREALISGGKVLFEDATLLQTWEKLIKQIPFGFSPVKIPLLGLEEGTYYNAHKVLDSYRKGINNGKENVFIEKFETYLSAYGTHQNGGTDRNTLKHYVKHLLDREVSLLCFMHLGKEEDAAFLNESDIFDELNISFSSNSDEQDTVNDAYTLLENPETYDQGISLLHSMNEEKLLNSESIYDSKDNILTYLRSELVSIHGKRVSLHKFLKESYYIGSENTMVFIDFENKIMYESAGMLGPIYKGIKSNGKNTEAPDEYVLNEHIYQDINENDIEYMLQEIGERNIPEYMNNENVVHELSEIVRDAIKIYLLRSGDNDLEGDDIAYNYNDTAFLMNHKSLLYELERQLYIGGYYSSEEIYEESTSDEGNREEFDGWGYVQEYKEIINEQVENTLKKICGDEEFAFLSNKKGVKDVLLLEVCKKLGIWKDMHYTTRTKKFENRFDDGNSITL